MRNCKNEARGRRAFYTSSRLIAQGLLNRLYFDPDKPKDLLLRYRGGKFFVLKMTLVTKASLRQCIRSHIRHLNRHPCARRDSEQKIPCTPAKVESILAALRRLVEVERL